MNGSPANRKRGEAVQDRFDLTLIRVRSVLGLIDYRADIREGERRHILIVDECYAKSRLCGFPGAILQVCGLGDAHLARCRL